MVPAANSGSRSGREEDDDTLPTVLSIDGCREERVYSYEEAIDLAGNGCYSIGLMTTLSVVTLAMGVDMFGFSVVVTGCTCDFDLDISQTSVLLSMPFVGPIVMAYPWGYISDTQGRRRSLLIAMWVSFVVSAISAFSPNWVVLAVLKFISTSFCSCAQSASYTLLGESSAERVKDAYMLIMTSVLDFSLAAYVACLATMIARASGLTGVNLVGTYILSNCDVTFYVIAANFFCAVLVSFFLPPDKIKKTT